MGDFVSSGIAMRIYPVIQCDICETWYHSSCDVLKKDEADRGGSGSVWLYYDIAFFSVMTLGGGGGAIFSTLIVLCPLPIEGNYHVQEGTLQSPFLPT